MPDIKCSCGSDCKTGLSISGNELWFTDDTGKETLMYLTPNSLVELIKSAKTALMRLPEE